MMIDALYNYRQGDIHSAEFSDEFNKLCIPFEESLTEAQLTTFHKLLDCVSDTAAAEMRAAYKVGFKRDMSSMRWHISYSLRETTDQIACIVTSLKSRAVCTNSENAIGILLNNVPKSLFFTARY